MNTLMIQTEKISLLSEASSRGIQSIGGKAFHLSIAIQHGFPVPKGIVLHSNNADILNNQDELNSILHNVTVLLSEIGNGPFAVRSSGVAEDGAEHSFAGQFLSILNVAKENISQAIVDCIQSSVSSQVKNYDAKGTEGIAVIIQQMVNADCAGVAFSANPVTGERNCIVINSVKGLGDKLVSGEVTPEQIVVKNNEITQGNSKGILNEGMTRQVAELAQNMEKLFSAPQDIEWAFANGEIFLLQSRPITSLPIEPIPMAIEIPKGTWTRDDHMYISTYFICGEMKIFGEILGEVFSEFGLPAKRMAFATIGGTLYNKMEMEGGDGGSKVPPSFILWIASRLVPSLIRANKRALKVMNEKTHRKYHTQWENEWKKYFSDRINSFNRRELPQLSMDELIKRLDDSIDFIFKGISVHGKLGIAHVFCLAEFALFAQKHFGWDNTKVIAVLSGNSPYSSDIDAELEGLCSKYFSKEKIQSEKNPITSDFPHWFDSQKTFKEEVENWLEKNYLRTQSYDIINPTLGEIPTVVYQNIRGILLGLNAAKKDKAAILKETQKELGDARKKLVGEDLKKEFDELLKWAVLAYKVRDENGALTSAKIVGMMRMILLEIGTRIKEQIGKAENIFHLDEHEIRKAALGQLHGVKELVKLRAGQYQWALLNPGPKSYGPPEPPMPPVGAFPKGLRYAFTMLGWMGEAEMNIVKNVPESKDKNILNGVGVFAGSYKGIARIIDGPAQFDQVMPGEIMVCRITSGQWSTVFGRLGGLICEEGGLLSHPAIIAREFGLPSIVGVDGAMKKIRNGQTITVNGKTGQVHLHE